MRKGKNKPAVPELLQHIQSWLWYNERYKVFFSKHKTNNPNEYYMFVLDIGSASRKHGRYKVLTDGITADMLNIQYSVTEHEGMRRHNVIMIRLTDLKNELINIDFLAIPIPESKGEPYTIDYNPPVIRPTPEYKKY